MSRHILCPECGHSQAGGTYSSIKGGIHPARGDAGWSTRKVFGKLRTPTVEQRTIYVNGVPSVMDGGEWNCDLCNKTSTLPRADNPLLVELLAKKCRCGREKQARNTFCNNCYYKLPSEIKKALYKRFGDGYEQAYDAAVQFLNGESNG